MTGHRKRAPRKRPAPRRKSDWITLVLGMPNTGKTTWVREQLEQENGNVIAWDPTGGLLTGTGTWEFSGPAREFLAYAAKQKRRVRRARVWGSLADFRGICGYVLRAGRTVFAIDEAHVVLPATITSKHPFCDLLVQVRHLNVPLLLVSWRPHNLPAFARSGCSRVVVFRLIDQRSREWLEREAGIAPKLVSTLPGLAVGSRSGSRFLVHRP